MEMKNGQKEQMPRSGREMEARKTKIAICHYLLGINIISFFLVLGFIKEIFVNAQRK